MSYKQIKVMIVEDDLDFIYLIEKMLNRDIEIDYTGYATNPADALDLAYSVHPDIVLMDLNLTFNELDGIETAKKIRCTTKAKVLIVTSFEDMDTMLHACVKSFASGYIFKSQYDSLLPTIKYAASGTTPQEQLIQSLILNQLSDAEKTVLQKVLGEEIAINSSSKTIANQKTNILKKLGLKNQSELNHIFQFMK